MLHNTDDLRIREIKELNPPVHIMRELPYSSKILNTVYSTRYSIHKILHGLDDRLIVIIGPCSIHDIHAGLEYANRLKDIRFDLIDKLEIVMRVYFEKPRTTIGWKGLINDPDLDGSFHINKGIRLARQLLLDVNEIGLPAGCEFLDMITPQYIADLVSWGAIGARTTESQVHRELASGLSSPVGFKNGTDGNIKIAVDAIKAASRTHHFLSVTKGGHSAIFSTEGNEDCHVILRGGKTPNYDSTSINIASKNIQDSGLEPYLMIDASHANSKKDPRNQLEVVSNIAEQISQGETRIVGIMIESHLRSGRQDLIPGKSLVYGKSITDACIGWDDTLPLLQNLAEAVKTRRSNQKQPDFANKNIENS